MVDADGSGEINEDELKIALTDYANQEGHEITDADREWVSHTWDEVDHNGNGELDFGEFTDFAHRFIQHYGLDN